MNGNTTKIDIIPYQEIIGNYSSAILLINAVKNYTIPRNNRELQPEWMYV